jgi:hypothetical protein
LERLTIQGDVTADEAGQVMISLKQLDIGKRNHESVFLHVADVVGGKRAREMLRRIEQLPGNVKRSDACKLLRAFSERDEGRGMVRNSIAAGE